MSSKVSAPHTHDYKIPPQSIAICVLGFILILCIICGVTFLYYQTDKRSEKNTVRMITLGNPKKINDLEAYNGADIIDKFDDFRVIKIKIADKISYLYLSPTTYLATKDLTKIDTSIITENEKQIGQH